MKKYILTIAGIVVLASGLYMIRLELLSEGIMRGLPYVLIGIGCGIFAHGIGMIYENRFYHKHPDIAKYQQINVNDERNKTISYIAKSKGYTLMTYMMSVLILAFALMGVDIAVILTLVVCYLFIQIYTVYCRIQLDKEM